MSGFNPSSQFAKSNQTSFPAKPNPGHWQESFNSQFNSDQSVINDQSMISNQFTQFPKYSSQKLTSQWPQSGHNIASKSVPESLRSPLFDAKADNNDKVGQNLQSFSLKKQQTQQNSSRSQNVPSPWPQPGQHFVQQTDQKSQIAENCDKKRGSVSSDRDHREKPYKKFIIKIFNIQFLLAL